VLLRTEEPIPGSKLKTAVTGKVKKGSKQQIDVNHIVHDQQDKKLDHLLKLKTILILELIRLGVDGIVK
jgi:hypothetical protein